ncbi:ABC transporter permease subunit [Marispirochaeta sp.]|jgi:sn-glycerol 3-phosphate transport system permease protein|uniref:ABC transporter permease subunit n=1 Tax=Marispirochaeta sp. TaxID=2038653 RepID=UPI0029C8CE78|nr:ABC transporter permease subunit [Marispirochaeta sp.]
MKDKQIIYKNQLLPYLLIMPELIIILLFFFWPALQAFYQSFLIEDPFGLSSQFVWFDNYLAVFSDALYLSAVGTTMLFSFWITLISMVSGLVMAWLVFQLKKRKVYQTFIIWPYALAPAVAGVIWYFIFNPTLGVLPWILSFLGIAWDPLLVGKQAVFMVILALSWKQISYNFLFYLAGLEGIPKSLMEAAMVAGASSGSIFFRIIQPLLSSTTFFLFTMNMLYTIFDSFGAIHSLTSGGPNHATENLVYKVYSDGFIGLNLGSASAQSVIIMIIAISFTLIQFKGSGKKGII